jgi:hypothetical protein
MKNASYKSWQDYRRRMLEETSRFIEWGLEHPDEVIEIPAEPAGQNSLPVRMADWFWAVALSDERDVRFAKWRQVLLRRPRQVLGRITRLR